MKILIIDANALLHRSFHALPPLKNSKGQPTGAIYGFLLTLFKAMKDLNPDYIAACFDLPAPTFRHKEYKEYKAKRPKTPDEIVQQFPETKEVLRSFNIPIFEKEGFEADDLIATISNRIPKEAEAYILTGDLDTLQLVSKNIKIYTLGKGVKETVIYDKEKIIQRFGILPEQVVDFKALAGDPSDNIPGAEGIGKKTATELIKKFGSIENLYREIENDSQSSHNLRQRTREILIKQKEQVFFSYILAKARKDAPIEFDFNKCRFGAFNKEGTIKRLKDLEFYSLISRLPQIDIKDKEGSATNGKNSCLRTKSFSAGTRSSGRLF